MDQDRGCEEANDKRRFGARFSHEISEPEYPDMRLILSTDCLKILTTEAIKCREIQFKKKLDLSFLGYVGTVSDD